MLRALIAGLVSTFFSPLKVFYICGFLAIFALLFDGTFFRLWSLHRDHANLQYSIASLQHDNQELAEELKKARDPFYLERQARERLQMVQEKEMLFLFAEDE